MKAGTTRKLRIQKTRKHQTVTILTIPPDLVQKLEEDYQRPLIETSLRLEYTTELSVKNLLPKMYRGAILITPELD